MTTPTPEALAGMSVPATPVRCIVCGPSKEYAYGDPPPPKERGYMEFCEWQEAQLKRHRQKETR